MVEIVVDMPVEDVCFHLEDSYGITMEEVGIGHLYANDECIVAVLPHNEDQSLVLVTEGSIAIGIVSSLPVLHSKKKKETLKKYLDSVWPVLSMDQRKAILKNLKKSRYELMGTNIAYNETLRLLSELVMSEAPEDALKVVSLLREGKRILPEIARVISAKLKFFHEVQKNLAPEEYDEQRNS